MPQKNYKKLFLFAGDQKIEHLLATDPEHLFKIASQASIDAFATQLGLISHYGRDYSNIDYVVKLNSKTNLVTTQQKDPLSLALHSVADVVQFANQTKLSIVGVGYTVYLGSEYEAQMLAQAAQVVYQAHQHDLLAILWMYPRGKSVTDERDPQLLAGAASVAACLGADFVKINPPDKAENLKNIVVAAGKTKVICSGGDKQDEDKFLQALQDQITIGHTCGCAVGRNIHQRELSQAVALCEKIKKVLG